MRLKDYVKRYNPFNSKSNTTRVMIEYNLKHIDPEYLYEYEEFVIPISIYTKEHIQENLQKFYNQPLYEASFNAYINSSSSTWKQLKNTYPNGYCHEWATLTQPTTHVKVQPNNIYLTGTVHWLCNAGIANMQGANYTPRLIEDNYPAMLTLDHTMSNEEKRLMEEYDNWLEKVIERLFPTTT